MFTVHCENIVRAATRQTTHAADPETAGPLALTTRSPSNGHDMERRTPRKLHPDMIRRVDDAPKLVNPSGSISEGQAGPTDVRTMNQPENWELSPLKGAQRRQSPSSIESVSSRVGRSQKQRS